MHAHTRARTPPPPPPATATINGKHFNFTTLHFTTATTTNLLYSTKTAATTTIAPCVTRQM